MHIHNYICTHTEHVQAYVIIFYMTTCRYKNSNWISCLRSSFDKSKEIDLLGRFTFSVYFVVSVGPQNY